MWISTMNLIILSHNTRISIQIAVQAGKEEYGIQYVSLCHISNGATKSQKITWRQDRQYYLVMYEYLPTRIVLARLPNLAATTL